MKQILFLRFNKLFLSFVYSLTFFVSGFLTHRAHAGVMEISGSYGIRTSKIDADNYTKNEVTSGSFAWYFWERSALELSYSEGTATQSLKATGVSRLIYYAKSQIYGADLILTLGGKDSVLQPFIRGGVAKVKKKMYREDTANGQIDAFGLPVDNVVPAYGAGIAVKLTASFSLKFSYDRIKSGSTNDSTTWDDSAKAGVSWYF